MVDRGSRHPRELLSSRIDGEIEPSEARFLQAHLDRCAECRRKESDLKAVAEGLARLALPAIEPEAIERLAARLRAPGEPASPAADVAANPEASEDRDSPLAKRSRLPLAVVAAAVIGLSTLAYVGSRSRSSEFPPAPEPSLREPASPPAQHHSLPAPPSPPPPLRRAAAPPEVRGKAPEPPSRIAPTPPAPPPPDFAVEAPDAPAALTPATREVASDPPPSPPAFPALQFKKKSDRLSQEAQQVAESVAGYLRDHPETTLWIEGHADGRGSEAENLALAEQRAKAVARYMTSLGTPTGRIRTKSHGAGSPSAPGDDREARKANNRVEFVVRR